MSEGGECHRRMRTYEKHRRMSYACSDHHLVTATLQIKLVRELQEQRIGVEKLCEPKSNSAFILQLKNKFTALADVSDSHTEPVAFETV